MHNLAYSALRICSLSFAVSRAVSVMRMSAIGATVSAVAGVMICWAGDAIVEKTQPTTFKNPIWSAMSNFKMAASMLKGDMSI
ncbi:Protein of unknown function (DUF962), putative [Leishmania shawi]|uniref:Uncharacterized protein n=1 Tax=Leishmania shawi TaxID=5680 RepID=A0ABR3EEB4_9TRYP